MWLLVPLPAWPMLIVPGLYRGEHADRREGAEQRRLAGKCRRDIEHAYAAHHDGVAVGRGVGGGLDPDQPARARTVVDHDRLVELAAHRLAHQA